MGDAVGILFSSASMICFVHGQGWWGVIFWGPRCVGREIGCGQRGWECHGGKQCR